jgi:capsular exopolysaccharide synthesis family protein
MHEQHANSREHGFSDTLRMLHRRKIIISIPILLGAAIGWTITTGQESTYQSSAVMMLDARKVEVINIDSVVSRLPQDNAVLRSELDLISSRMLAGRVVDQLNLTQDHYLWRPQTQVPAWVKPMRDLQANMAGWFPSGARILDAVLPEPAATPTAPTRDQAIDHVISGARVSNDGRSYTIIVSFTSFDPQHSARIANAIAEQYLNLQTEMKSDATRQANKWLSQRLSELQEAVETSEQAIEDYRQKEGLFVAGGELLDTNRLSTLNQRRDEVRLRRLEAESRLQSVRALVNRGAVAGDVNETAGSDILRTLRQQEIELRRKIADLSSRAYSQHPQLVTLNNDLAVVQQRSREEATRIVNTLSNEIEIARAQEASLDKSLGALKVSQGKTNTGSVVMRQLMREAEANRSIYEVVLNRYKQTAQQVDLQRPDGSIISPALPQTEPAASRRMSIIAISLLGGALLGVLLALLREYLDQTVRSVPDLERATGLPVIGLVPNLRHGWFGRPEDKIVQQRGAVLRDSLRITQIAIRPQAIDKHSYAVSRPQVILVTSALSHEGKTTFCISMARMLAADGKRVMLIDADLRCPRVGPALGAEAGGDLIDLLECTRPFEDAIRIDAKSGLHYLTSRSSIENPQSVLSGVAFQQLIQACSRSYDAIIIDTPPVLVAPDSAIIAPLADTCVFLARWGHTPLDSIQAGLRLLHLCKVKVSGIVLSRVRAARSSGYAPYGGQDIYPPVHQAASQIDR